MALLVLLRPLVSIPPTPLHPSWPNWLAPRLVKTAQFRSRPGSVAANGCCQSLLPEHHRAVWEVVQTLPNTTENYDFGVYITFKNNIPQNNGDQCNSELCSDADCAVLGSAAGLASNSLTIPRFAVAAVPPERIS